MEISAIQASMERKDLAMKASMEQKDLATKELMEQNDYKIQLLELDAAVGRSDRSRGNSLSGATSLSSVRYVRSDGVVNRDKQGEQDVTKSRSPLMRIKPRVAMFERAHSGKTWLVAVELL
jgi:hypothetical protein